MFRLDFPSGPPVRAAIASAPEFIIALVAAVAASVPALSTVWAAASLLQPRRASTRSAPPSPKSRVRVIRMVVGSARMVDFGRPVGVGVPCVGGCVCVYRDEKPRWWDIQIDYGWIKQGGVDKLAESIEPSKESTRPATPQRHAHALNQGGA
jgi:hypothetical protein